MPGVIYINTKPTDGEIDLQESLDLSQFVAQDRFDFNGFANAAGRALKVIRRSGAIISYSQLDDMSHGTTYIGENVNIHFSNAKCLKTISGELYNETLNLFLRFAAHAEIDNMNYTFNWTD